MTARNMTLRRSAFDDNSILWVDGPKDASERRSDRANGRDAPRRLKIGSLLKSRTAFTKQGDKWEGAEK